MFDVQNSFPYDEIGGRPGLQQHLANRTIKTSFVDIEGVYADDIADVEISDDIGIRSQNSLAFVSLKNGNGFFFDLKKEDGERLNVPIRSQFARYRPNGRMDELAIVTRNDTVVIWSITANRPKRIICTKGRIITALSYGALGHRMAIGMNDGTIWICGGDVEGEADEFFAVKLPPSSGEIKQIDFYRGNDNLHVLSQSGEYFRLNISALKKSNLIRPLIQPSKYVFEPIMESDGDRYIFFKEDDYRFSIWHIYPQNGIPCPVQINTELDGGIVDLIWCSDRRIAVIGRNDLLLYQVNNTVWSLYKDKQLPENFVPLNCYSTTYELVIVGAQRKTF